jgi:hypothetical protein
VSSHVASKIDVEPIASLGPTYFAGMAEEWRVEAELGEEGHGLSLGERLRTLDLDDEARERLGDRVVVTRDGSRMFLYARSPQEASAAAEVVQSLAGEEGIEASTELTRWDDEAEAWVATAGSEGEAGEGESAGEAEWEARVVLSSFRKALEVAHRLRDEGLEVRRRFRFVLALAPSEEAANQLAERLRAEVPEAESIDVERATGVTHPVFVMLGSHEPEIARDLGL